LFPIALIVGGLTVTATCGISSESSWYSLAGQIRIKIKLTTTEWLEARRKKVIAIAWIFVVVMYLVIAGG